MVVLKIGDNTPPTRLDVDRTLRRLTSAKAGLFDDAKLIKGVTLIDGVVVRRAHGLGHPIRGYLVVGARTGDAAGYITDEHDTRHGDLGQFMYIKANGFSPTVDLVVF